jgi:hypothetical protein
LRLPVRVETTSASHLDFTRCLPKVNMSTKSVVVWLVSKDSGRYDGFKSISCAQAD